MATGPGVADGAAVELLFRTSHPDLTVAHFDPGLTATGYSYLFVREGLGTMGAAQVRRRGRLRDNARVAFRRLLELFPMPVDPIGRERGLFMSFSLPRHLRHGSSWYVGEAAGVQDFLFGLGNRLGLRSAALVAGAVAGDGWSGRRFRSEIVAPMRASVLGRWIWETAGAGAVARLCRWLGGGDFRERLIRLQRPEWWRLTVARVVMARWGGDPDPRRPPVAAWWRRAEGLGT